MTTTEEIELLAQTHDLARFTLGMKAPEHDLTSAALRSLAAERDTLRQERDGANALVERMHEQDVLAIKAWQAMHPGSELTWPSSARLSAWCMGEVASVAAERDALRAERNAERNARFKAEAEFSHMQRRIARQRRALAKLYRKRHDKNGRLSSFLTGLTAENARLREAVKGFACTCTGRCEDMEWRTAIYDALIEWHDPPRDDETPKAALRRLVHTEILAALDPAVSRPAADLVAQARRDALEEAARVARHYATIVPMHGSLKCDIYEAAGQAATEIAASIDALAKGEGDE
jgi:hypothetical protein